MHNNVCIIILGTVGLFAFVEREEKTHTQIKSHILLLLVENLLVKKLRFCIESKIY